MFINNQSQEVSIAVDRSVRAVNTPRDHTGLIHGAIDLLIQRDYEYSHSLKHIPAMKIMSLLAKKAFIAIFIILIIQCVII